MDPTITLISKHRKLLILGLLLFLYPFSFIFSHPVSAQYRDFMTESEVEIIRDAQEIDMRIAALVNMADRRFGVLNLNVASPSAGKKEKFEWGLLPTEERLELLNDIKKILDKAVADIDNLSERPDAAILPDPEEKRPKTLKELFPIAVRNLANAAGRYRPVLATQLNTSPDQKQRGVILDVLDTCDQILEAVKKLPPEPVKKKGKN